MYLEAAFFITSTFKLNISINAFCATLSATTKTSINKRIQVKITRSVWTLPVFGNDRRKGGREKDLEGDWRLTVLQYKVLQTLPKLRFPSRKNMLLLGMYFYLFRTGSLNKIHSTVSSYVAMSLPLPEPGTPFWNHSNQLISVISGNILSRTSMINVGHVHTEAKAQLVRCMGANVTILWLNPVWILLFSTRCLVLSRVEARHYANFVTEISMSSFL